MTDHMLRRTRDMRLTLDSITESWGPYLTEPRTPESPQSFLKAAHTGDLSACASRWCGSRLLSSEMI